MSAFGLDIYDVIISGSGPAGASAAYILAKAGKKVLVLEKEKLPRYKTCGGGITFKGLNLIPFDLNGVLEKQCYSVEINDFEADISITTKRERPIVSMTMRNNFDYQLINEAKKCGAEVKDNMQLKELNYLGNNIEVTLKNDNEKFYSKFFIAADGALSSAAKTYFEKDERNFIPALEYEIYVDKESLFSFGNSPRFDFGVVPGGYGWIFPKEDHLSIGVLSFKQKNCNLNYFFSNYLKSLGIKEINKSERHGFVIPLNFRKTFAKDRILLVGDAAGFTDPITAEGISFAIKSGQLAAESILKENLLPEPVCREYNFQISKNILPELKAGRILSFFIYRYSKLRIFIIKLYGKQLSELITDVVMGEKKYSGLIRDPFNYFKLLFKWSLINKQSRKFFNKINTMRTNF